jgi:3-oxoacyl-[acyl-carrier protein] reductase
MAGLYTNKTVLVTGSRRGVGRMLSEYLIANGAAVIGFAIGDSTMDHPQYFHMKVDISDYEAVNLKFSELRKRNISIDILINNAAIQTSQYAMLLSPTSALAMIQTNLFGSFVVSREVAKMMHKSKWGRIINIGSMLQTLEPVGSSIYTACKNGLESMAHVMAKEMASFGVTCNTIAISAIQTDMLKDLPKEKFDKIIMGLPIPRYTEPDDVFNVLDFFASERSSYVTAQTIYLGGVS